MESVDTRRRFLVGLVMLAVLLATEEECELLGRHSPNGQYPAERGGRSGGGPNGDEG